MGCGVLRAQHSVGAQSMLCLLFSVGLGVATFSLCLGEVKETYGPSIFLLGFGNKFIIPLAKSGSGSWSQSC